MKTQLNLSVCLFFTLLSCISCSNDNEPAKTPGAIFPLALGNEWIYQDSIIRTNSISTEHDTVRITNKTTINGVEGYYMASENEEAIYCTNTDKDGNFVLTGVIAPTTTILVQSVFFKNYPTPGEKWIHVNINQDSQKGYYRDSITVKCEAIDVAVKTTIGTFKCNAYSYVIYSGSQNQYKDSFMYYFSRGIGRIKTFHCEDNKLRTISTLVKYNLK